MTAVIKNRGVFGGMHRMTDNLKNELQAMFPGRCLFDEPMSRHTSFKIGGPAEALILPDNAADVAEAVRFCHENGFPRVFLGNGTNVLVGDRGLKGVVIKLTRLNAVALAGPEEVYAQAGASLKDTARFAAENALAGLEFASGIPGSVGGAVYMNAGAYGEDIGGVVKSVDVIALDPDRGVCERASLSAAQMDFGYRSSRAQAGDMVILGARFALKTGLARDILDKIRELDERRARKQPLDLPSAGSVFKRPKGDYAGRLIMDSDLRGYSVGGAQISELHCGFIVNKGGASARDVLGLIAHVRDTVFEKSGVRLEPEVRLIGDFDSEANV